MKFLEFDDTGDFPFYRHNPRIPKSGWFLLLLSVPIAYLVYIFVGTQSELIASIMFCLFMLIPLLYYSGWDYSLMFRRPTKNEIILGVLLFAGYMIYAMVISGVLDVVGLGGVAPESAEAMGVNIQSTVGLLFSMMGEELLKFIPLMFLMRVVYKFSNNLKLSVVISVALVLIGFGLLHYDPPTNTLASVLVLQGLGSMFEMYGYLKTKNLFVPYISHFLTDAVSFVLILFGL